MFKKLISCCLIAFTLIFNLSNAQTIDYSVDLYSPLGIPLILAGNFGELRSNHFHTGIDIKTNAREGYNIYSVEDGYVYRIKVSPWGYGHVVYINHPNGLTSVYAHLQQFKGELKDLAYQQQAKNEGFEIDYYPTKDSLKVKRGQIIAISGNTGGSTGPHLHFELRETATDEPLNPLLFNFEIEDNIPPIIRNLKVYGLTKEGYRIPGKSMLIPVQGNNGNYSINQNKITLNSSYLSQGGGIGFAFDVIDKLNGAPNQCGIHEAFLMVDNDTVFVQSMERISFLNNRQINTHKDYEEFHQFRRQFHKAFKTPHNTMPIYGMNKNNGVIPIEPGVSKKIRYIVKDSYGNTSRLDFVLEVNSGEINKQKSLYLNKKTLYPDSAFISYTPQYYILFPEGILYEPTPLVLSVSHKGVQFGNDKVPLQETFKLMLPINDQSFGDKYYIQRITSDGKTVPEGGVYNDGWITSRIRSFGLFTTKLDTIPPAIEAKNFKENQAINGKQIGWTIFENGSGLKRYTMYIDDVWYLLEYEPKKSLFFFNPPSDLKGKKTIKIVAEDRVGNIAEKEFIVVF